MSRFVLIQLYPWKGRGERGTIFTTIIFIVVVYSFGMVDK